MFGIRKVAIAPGTKHKAGIRKRERRQTHIMCRRRITYCIMVKLAQCHPSVVALVTQYAIVAEMDPHVLTLVLSCHRSLYTGIVLISKDSLASYVATVLVNFMFRFSM